MNNRHSIDPTLAHDPEPHLVPLPSKEEIERRARMAYECRNADYTALCAWAYPFTLFVSVLTAVFLVNILTGGAVGRWFEGKP